MLQSIFLGKLFLQLQTHRAQNFKGKIRACINAAVIPALMWLRGGKKVKVYYRNLVAQLFK